MLPLPSVIINPPSSQNDLNGNPGGKGSDVYFEAALALSRAGSVIVVDNVVRKGEVSNAETTDANILGIRRMMDRIAREPRVSATALQTVGSKGYDGFVLAIVRQAAAPT